MALGTTTFTAHVVDADGLDSDIPWPVEVKNDATLADGWMWPDRDRWRVSAIRFDQLPPKVNATDVGTFAWRCFADDCEATCSLDGEAERACRSPVEVAGLTPGNHRLVVQPRSAAGAAIDLPQRYDWSVPSSSFVRQHAAAQLMLSASVDGAADIDMVSLDTTNIVVTCSVDGRHERPCNAGLSISGVGGNGDVARVLTVRVRARSTGQELQSPRMLHLNDPEDADGDGWLDIDDPCLSGAERGVACNDVDGDGVANGDDLCPLGVVRDNGFVQVSAGARHVCARRRSGEVFCAGLNSSGQLGDGTATNRSEPVRVVGLGDTVLSKAVDIASGQSHTCAVLADGSVRCWGGNANGALGDNTTTNQNIPTAVADITSAVRVTAGGEFSCALMEGATVRCWGRNDVGQLADATTTRRLTPVTSTALSEVASIAAGLAHACAALTDGTVRCWGENNLGRLGDGDAAGDVNRATPVVVTGISDALAIESGRAQSCVLRTGGALSCWGDNREAGALGIGTLVGQATPAQVFAGGVTRLAIGIDDGSGSASTTMCAQTSSGFRCWGRNAEGQFGIGTVSNGSASPVAVAAANDAVDVAVGNGFTCIVRTDGTVSCWGRNAEGQLGDGANTRVNTVPSTSPASWSPPPYFRGPLFNDLDGDGCEDP